MKKLYTTFSIFLLAFSFVFLAAPKTSEAGFSISLGLGLGYTSNNGYYDSYRGYGGYYSPSYYGHSNTIYPRYGDYGPLYRDNYYSNPGWNNCWTYPCY